MIEVSAQGVSVPQAASAGRPTLPEREAGPCAFSS